jgi:hypothetical protein
MTARWRLQLLAELGVGWQIREKLRGEKSSVSHLKQSFGARNGAK